MEKVINYNKEKSTKLSIVVECSVLNAVAKFFLPASRQGALQMSLKI